mmetsp:Transcript_30480/g.74229  ORF Transcript_30480/g.74229 Transcript_30480/m.74229 type:complete len:85 (-) Transcript_30480:233-487(-)
MSQVLGVTGELGHEAVWDAMERVGRACAASGVAWGTVPTDDGYAQRALGMGAQLFLAGHDFAVIHKGLAATKASYPSLFPSQPT